MYRLYSIICSVVTLFFMLTTSCISKVRNTITSGIYEFHGTSILVEGNNLKITYEGSSDCCTIMDGAIIAECEISYLKDNFYSLQSTDIPLKMFEDLSVQYIPKVLEDSASVMFNFPNLNWDYGFKFNIVISETLSTKEYSFICNSDNCVIKIPRNGNYYISIAPLEFVSYNVWNNYLGLLQFDDLKHVYSTHCQDLIITMPNVTRDMFNRWFLHDVIIEVDDEIIKLFGCKYKRIKLGS